jgi:hypothetical protein
LSHAPVDQTALVGKHIAKWLHRVEALRGAA